MRIKRRGVLNVLVSAIVAVAFVVGLAIATPDTSHAADSNDKGITCAVEKIGWIVCPIVEGAAMAADKAYNFLAGFFLEVPPELFNNDSPTRVAWEQARNLANVVFVIAFIILIYSQITGGVMSNYGIKRMLPRLIIAAVAVNVSYYICQGMVDISNILGYNIKAALDQMSDGLPKVLGQDTTQAGSTNTQTADGRLGKIVTIGLALAGIVWALILLMGGSLGVVLGTILFIMLALLLRKAFIILLIVASPLAFVAYLLPNTEQYFKKWLDMFWKLLMVFPIVAALMGTGQLASGIVLNSGVSGQVADCNVVTLIDKNGKPCSAEDAQKFDTGHGQAPIGLGLAAAVIAIGPLFFVLSVLKAAIAVAGALGAKISAEVEKSSKGVGAAPGAALGGIKKGRDLYNKTNFAQRRAELKKIKDMHDPNPLNLASRYRRRKAFNEAALNNLKHEAQHGAEHAILGRLGDPDDDYLNKFAGDGRDSEAGMRARAAALSAAKKHTGEEIQNLSVLGEAEALAGGARQDVKYKKMLEDAFNANGGEGDEKLIKAYISMLAAQGKAGEDRLEEVLAHLTEKQRSTRAFRGAMNHILTNHGQMDATSHGIVSFAWYGANAVDKNGNSNGVGRSIEDINSDEGAWRDLSVAQLANQRGIKPGDGDDPLIEKKGLKGLLSQESYSMVDPKTGKQTKVSGIEYAAAHNLIGRVDNGGAQLAREIAASKGRG